MSEDDGDSSSSPSRTAGTGEHKSAPPMPYENGRQSTAEAGDTTPTQSRRTSPLQTDLVIEKSAFYSGNTVGTSESCTAVANGFDASDASVDRSEPNNFVDPLYARSPPDRGHTSLGLSNVYDPLLSPSPSSPHPSRSLTPKFRSTAPPASDGNVNEDMPNSSPHSGPSPGSSRQSSRRQPQPQQPQQVHQQQQRGLQPYGFYASPSASESGLPRNTPSVSNQSGPPPFVHGQQAAAPQRSASFTVPYTMSPSPASLYPQHQPQHQYTYPQLNIHGMPSMAHSPAHPSPEFYSVGHSMSPSQPPLYAPSFHTSVPPEHTPTPTLTFDYDGGNSGRSPAPGASSPYSPQQSFAPFNYHPTLTATPQFSHSPFSSSLSTHQVQHAQRPQYPPPFAYMTGASPTTSDDSAGQQPSARWWYIPPHSASPTAGSYPNVYYLDAYGNPSNARGLGLGPGFPSLSSPSSGLVQPAAFPLPDSAVGAGPGPGSGTGRGGITAEIQREGDSKPGSIASPPGAPLSPSSGAPGESVSERGQQQQLKQPKRKSVLPNPPVQRSEWVMWVGNVPSDATHDELWRFFTRSSTQSGSSDVEMRSSFGQRLSQPPHLPAGLLSPSGSSSASDASPVDSSGVTSVFLIARSNCAFVNYTNAVYLSSAVQRFNGIPLRPGDARCPRLVCRVRGKEEDLKAGVGGQRGTGIHTRWVKEQREREWGREQNKQAGRKEVVMSDDDASASEPPGTPSSSVVHTESGAESSGQDAHAVRRPPHHSSSSGSTTSGFLARYFPKRYFILKSLTQFDLDLSVEKGVWATQPHNEAILNQAFRNSSDVYLIFGVNKSGEFFGYARMASAIGKTADDRVSWASRSDSQHSHSPTTSLASSVAGKGSHVNETIPEESEGSSPEGNDGGNTKRREQDADEEKRSYLLFSPSEHRLAEDSPKPVTPATQKRLSNAEESSSSKVSLSGEANTAPPSDRHQEKFAESVPQNRTSLHLATPPISAPAVMGRSYGDITTPQVKGLGSETLDPRLLRRRLPSVQLDPEAPLRAVREHEAHSASVENPLIKIEDDDRVKRRDTLGTSVSASGSGSKLREVLQAEEVQEEIDQETKVDTDAGKDKQAGTDAPDDRADIPPQWGSPFKVQWIRVTRLPFHRTRHLRNPWNHDREVKVSRDGTELEPLVGQALLDEWDKEESPHVPPTPAMGGGGGGGTSLSAMNRRTGQFQRMQSHVSASTTESEAGPSPGPSRVYQPKQRPR
ncbi:uncharacterized protein FOMMEDRAFT_23945 [Fomitiporia mediterranea MF3/22]|uniref:uncharacterized protein n=1 Tax=Fomitiporia mediterranea (strain MF3/22) TaxID=694068 RepID=UPI0004407FD6|nr:uncharacterized protein FOMMEDRAFT_23945 [Fomitiporia mediterranea MF3/22]EJC97872.1 hypothetical protein FOMMEDRAFT_23945 [Fomitiporia mediterranea MF3/22]